MAARPETSSEVAAVQANVRSPASELGPRANRTIAKILEATRSIFLSRGYAGTTIDEIARVAKVSRPSFYTYFPTKRDVLLTLGADSARAVDEIVDRFADLAADWSREDIENFVADYFLLLDDHGGFAFAWTQAAHEDAEIFAAGQARHLGICQRFGELISKMGVAACTDSAAAGLVWFAMLERSWSYCQLYDAITREAVEAEAVEVLMQVLRPA